MTDEELARLLPFSPVRKATGDYQWDGLLCVVFMTPTGKLRAVVAHPANEGHVLHIYAARNLERIADD